MPTMTDLRLDPFFSGRGLDRADALRADEDSIEALASAAGALQLKWHEGLPELTPDGRLAWAAPSNPELFLGFEGESPRFSAIENVTALITEPSS